MRAFLVEWKTLVLDRDWKQRSVGRSDELTRLCDAGNDYEKFLSTEAAVGNAVVLIGICGVLSKLKGERIEAQVRSTSTQPRSLHASSARDALRLLLSWSLGLLDIGHGI